MRRVKWIILITVAVLLLVSPCVYTGVIEDRKETLRGIKGIEVLVEGLDPEVERFGLTRDKLQTDVELKLRMAGIKVLSEKELATMPRVSYLYVNINTSHGPGSFVFNISVSMKQLVSLERNPNLKFFAPTWGKEAVGGELERYLEIRVRNDLKDKIDQFLNDYLAVNPKRKANLKGKVKQSTKVAPEPNMEASA